MISKPDIRRCGSEEAESRRGWTRGSVPTRMLGLEGGGLWDLTLVGEENEAFFIRVLKPLPSKHILKTLSESSKGKAQREQYLLVVSLGRYNGIRARHRAMCQQGGWAPKGVDTRQCSSKDSGPEGGGLGVSADAGLQRGVDCEISHWLGRRTKYAL